MKVVKKIMAKLTPIAVSTALVAASAQATTQPYAQIDQYIEQNKQVIELNTGTAVAIVKGDKVVYEGYFGYADIEKRIPVDNNTVFYIASMTKAFTSLLALLLEHEQKLDTNQTLAAMFPDIKFKPAVRADEVTIKDMLSHTTGIDNWPLIQATAYTGQYDKALIDRIIEASYVNENAPHGQFDYTNVGYNLLSHWMDNNLGKSWQDLLQQHIFQPLNMTHTSAKISDVTAHHWSLAQGYSVKSPEPSTPVYLKKTDNSMHAAGGMVSTASDLARFLMMHMNQGDIADRSILPTEVVEKSQQKVASYDWFGEQSSYGWGWFFRDIDGQTLLEHRGGYAGASTYMSFMPEQQIGLVVLTNQDRWGGDLAYAIESLAYSIAMGKGDDEVEQIVEKHTAFVEGKVEKYYGEKANTSIAKPALLSKEYIGHYVHDTLGQIEVSQGKDKTLVLRWGNLVSPLYQGEATDSLAVEFVPNSHEPVVFLKGTDKQLRFEYRDYVFTQSTTQ